MYDGIDEANVKTCLSAGLECDWFIIESRSKQKFLMVFGVKECTTLVDFKIACGNVRFNWSA